MCVVHTDNGNACVHNTQTMVMHVSISCLYTKARQCEILHYDDLGQHNVHAPKQCRHPCVSLSLSLKMKIETVKFDNHSNFYFYFSLDHLKTLHLHD